MTGAEANLVAVVAGVGSGTGEALVRRFAEGGYRVAMIARKEARLERIAGDVPEAVSYPCDMADIDKFRATLARIKREMGSPKVAIHNGARALRERYDKIDPLEFEQTFRVNATALLVLAQEVCPAMVEMGDCALLVTGNTGAWRGKPHFTGFAPSKSAQRILAEALARDLGPQGVHVAYITIDAAIDIWWVRERRGPDHVDDNYAKPADIAGECFHIAHQPKSTWSFNVELRPYNETW
ncbi:MAG: SDR family NAD(P)-dependent oxidoreductase [Rickettsiales bacterium]